MIRTDDVTLVGKVVKTHGVNGEMSATFDIDGFDEIVVPGSCLIFNLDGIFVPFFVNTVRTRGSESLLLSLDDEDSQEKAAKFVGKDIYMVSEVVGEIDDSDPDQLYASDLIGFKACMADDTPIGEIIDVDDSTDNPLFIIDRGDDAPNALIPIVDEFIENINPQTRIINFQLPEGLLDL